MEKPKQQEPNPQQPSTTNKSAATTKSAEIYKIVQEAREYGASEDNLRQLKRLGAHPRIGELLKQETEQMQQAGTSNPRDIRKSITDNSTYFRTLLEEGNCWEFNRAICLSVIEDIRQTEPTTKSREDYNLQQEARILIGLKDEVAGGIAEALETADSRFIRGLYRSSAIAYGLIHLAWPNENPWTLYNWMRSLERAHPDIYSLVKNLIPHP
jgi:hypothetical protein